MPTQRSHTTHCHKHRIIKHALLVAACFVTALTSHSTSAQATDNAAAAKAQRNKHISDSIEALLPKATTYTDSLGILYDLFDLAPRDQVNQAGERVLTHARTARDSETLLDMYRRLASFNSAKDSIRLQRYQHEVTQLPPSDNRDGTLCFIYLCQTVRQARYATEEQRYKRISQLIDKYKNNAQNRTVQQKVEMLFTLCNYLDNTIPGEMLTGYITELGQLLPQLPFRHDGIDNMYYLHAATSYTNNDQPENAVAADLQLLHVIDNLDRTYRAQGRHYRDYTTYRYTVYRRMLSNAEALSPQQIEDIYAKIKHLAATDPSVEADFKRKPLATAFYLMATGNHTQAIEPLKQSLAIEKSHPMRRRLLRLLLQAATEAGDKETQLQAATQYNKILEETLDRRTAERGREFQTLYNVSLLEQEKTALQAQQHQDKIFLHHAAIWAIVATVIILIAFIIGLWIASRKARALGRTLKQANLKLQTEAELQRRTQQELRQARDRARRADRHKTEFINNMSHEVTTPLNALVECSHLIVDNIPDDRRKYLQRYAQTIDVSADMLRTLIGDVLDITRLESPTINVDAHTVSASEICEIAIESAHKHIKPGVQMTFTPDPDHPDHPITTDRRRVEQILVNLLNNSAKFTDTGTIDLSYRLAPQARQIQFIVTDTGSGIPHGKEELVFERFVKLDPSMPGTGLGLNISRMIATILHGTLTVDTTYTQQGTRVILTLPLA